MTYLYNVTLDHITKVILHYIKLHVTIEHICFITVMNHAIKSKNVITVHFEEVSKR